MEVCRACLATQVEMVPLDEAFVIAYNLLTSLNIALLDAMPQYVCQSCTQSIKFYIEFREKCITTETSLQEVILQKVKSEDDKPLSELKNAGMKIKDELKEEGNDNFDFGQDYFGDELLLYVKSEKSEGIKPKKSTCKKKKSQILTNVKLEPEIDALSCGLCERTCTDPTELSAHIESHKNNKTCGLCLAVFQIWPTLLGHRFTHIPKKEFRCHICRKAFWGSLAAKAVHMEYHYMNKHYDGEKVKLTCKLCFRRYETPRKLSKHMIHSHSKKRFICDYCKKIYNNKQLLTSHIRSHSDHRTFVCELCGFASKHSGGLKDHIIRKHSPAKAKCSSCERWFASPAERARHACSAEPRVCPVCGLQFNTTKNFTRHVSCHSAVKRYKCARCPAAYKTKSGLTAHCNRHDGIRPNQCPYCPQRFYTQSVLIKHKRIHTGEKPYVCKICHKGFTGNHNLKVHMKVHGECDLVVKRNKSEHGANCPPPRATPPRTHLKIQLQN